MKRFLLIAGIAFLFAGMLITGCKKETPNTDVDTLAAQDDANASYIMQDSKLIADGAAKGNTTEKPFHKYTTCGTVRKDSSTTTDTLDISFTGACTSIDGRTRKGDIIVYWSKDTGYFDSSLIIHIVYKSYSFTTLGGNTISVAGSSLLRNVGRDTAGDNSWSFSANLTLTYSSGGTITWNAAETCTLFYQYTDNLYYYALTGGGNGINKNGVNYNFTISNALYHTAFWLNAGWPIESGSYCDCFQTGEVAYTRNGRPSLLYLNYTSGLGNCSHTAAAYINSNSYSVTLP